MSDADIATLTAWVKGGAPWPDDAGGAAEARQASSTSTPARRRTGRSSRSGGPTVPEVRNPKSEIRNEIDRFLLAKLKAAGLTFAPPADKRTLLRRVYFDLIGLPPTPEEIDAFLKDDVARRLREGRRQLLASPHYGERWGRHWLDLVRYAETHGHEFDFDIPDAWRYRDYVIRAFNADVPYDQFVTEHIAGDLLAKPRRNPTDGTNESLARDRRSGGSARRSTRRSIRGPTTPTASTTRSTCSARRSSA